MDANLLAQLNAPKAKNKEDPVNGDNPTIDLLSQSAENAARAVGMISPIGGKKLFADLGSIGLGEASGLESKEGWASKSIMPGGFIPDAQGGVLAALGKALIKGGVALTDHTSGVGGDAMGSGSSNGFVPSDTPIAPSSGGRGGDLD